jgi:hypothetical protein
MVKEKFPSTAGVPLIKPAGERFSPGGNGPDTRLNITGNCPPDVDSCVL